MNPKIMKTTEMKPLQNGVAVIDKTFEDDTCLVRDGDLWECPNCDNRMIMGFGEQYKTTLEGLKNLSKNKVRVYDMATGKYLLGRY